MLGEVTGEQQGWRRENNIIRHKKPKPQQPGVLGRGQAACLQTSRAFATAAVEVQGCWFTEMNLGAVIGGG